MKIIYSKHAQKRMKERAIENSLIEECIEMPNYNVARGDVVESHRNVKDRILKVIWTRKNSFIKVISVMWK